MLIYPIKLMDEAYYYHYQALYIIFDSTNQNLLTFLMHLQQKLLNSAIKPIKHPIFNILISSISKHLL